MNTSITIIPKPVLVRQGNGVCECSGMPLISGDVSFQREIDAAISQSWNCAAAAGESRIICKKENVYSDELKSAEGYRLQINREDIVISASTGAGCFNGLQTLRQLFLSENHNGTVTLPVLEIEDYPRFSWRGYMLDSARHFFPVPVIKKLLDAISIHHINRFHWHLTDNEGWRFPVAKYPRLAEIGRNVDKAPHEWNANEGLHTEGLYTEEDIKELVAYAAARHIEIIPEVEFPGHSAAAITAYPGLGCPGKPSWNLCAGNDALFDFAATVFDTLSELFPSPYVHFGGDEVSFSNWEQCPRCKQRLIETGLKTPKELQSWIFAKLIKMLEDRGKTAVGWDEILDDTPRYKLPKSTVVMSWRSIEEGIRAGALGHRVIMCPTNAGCYFDYKPWNSPEEMGGNSAGMTPVIHTYEMDPVPPGMDAETAKLILGAQGNLWSNISPYGRVVEYLTFPRICALSEVLWSPKEYRNFDDFKFRLETHRIRLDALDILAYRGPLG